MRPSCALILTFSLLLCVACEARKGPAAEYWRSIMKEEAMPEAIERLYGTDENNTSGRGRFVKDFDIRPNVIIYHGHGGHSHGEASRDRGDVKV